MLLSDFFIARILNHIRSLQTYNETDIDRMRYSLQSLLWEIEKVIILFVLFTILGYQTDYLVALIILLTIRTNAGGYHSQNNLSCLVTTFLFFFLSVILLPLVPLNKIGMLLISGFSLMTSLLIAPLLSLEKLNIFKKKDIITKKIMTIILTSFWLAAVFFFHIYESIIIWIILLQNIQLLYEYIRRRRRENV